MCFVFIYREAGGLKRQHVPLFSHPNFLQNPFQRFILPSYAEASIVVLMDLCFVPPFLKPKTHYRPIVEMFIDDEAKEASV
jgi:hypothetical protein